MRFNVVVRGMVEEIYSLNAPTQESAQRRAVAAFKLDHKFHFMPEVKELQDGVTFEPLEVIRERD